MIFKFFHLNFLGVLKICLFVELPNKPDSIQQFDRVMELDRPTPIKDFDQDTQILPPWHVVLLDDNDHTYDYVIEMLQNIFGYSQAKSYRRI